MAIFETVAPVTVCALVGYLWANRGLAYETAFVTRIVTFVGFPCLIFKTLVTVEVEAGTLLKMGGLAAVTTLLFAVVGAVVLMLMALDRRAFLASLTFANTGNLGLSLCLLAFGEEGLALGIGYFVVSAVLVFLVGPALASGSFKLSAILKVPMIWATLAAMPALYFDWELPKWMFNSLNLIGGIAIPMMLITLGVSLNQLQVRGLGRALQLSLVRLGMGFAVGWGAAVLLGLEGAERGVLIVECAMPVAVFNYVHAEMYKTRPAEVAGLVMVSTVLSFITLPALMWFVMGH
jgi:predicted permease